MNGIEQNELFDTDEDNRKEVNIYIYSNGRYNITIFEYGNIMREVYDISEDARSVNRCVMYAVIKAINALKEPCKITLYLQTNVGFKYMENTKKKWRNRDLGNEIQESIQLGKHSVQYIDYSMNADLNAHRIFLKKRLFSKFGYPTELKYTIPRN
jgi:hypothetical protein